MNDAAWFEHNGDGTWTVLLRVGTPKGAYIRRWGPCDAEEVRRRMEAMRFMSAWRVEHGEPPIEVAATD